MTLPDPISLRNDVRLHLEACLQQHLPPDAVLYDVGCGTKPFAAFLEGKVSQHVGVDIEDGFYDAQHIDLVGTAYHVPAEDGTADAILSSQVIEHLDDPRLFFQEANRLLKEGGLLFLSFPFLYSIHAAPHDYERFTHYSIRKILHNSGFQLLEARALSGFWYLSGFYLSLYLQSLDRGLLQKTRLLRSLIWIVKLLFRVLHETEGWFLEQAGKRTSFREPWTVNYVMVAQKGNTPQDR
ncbi:MAG: class I SAM-dependent methyltransferase [Spartobacteria bacterium]|nr:class I SAM-dependent methyltransferase [Spartobacteria bacterium]